MNWAENIIEIGKVARKYTDDGIWECQRRNLFIEHLAHNNYYEATLRLAVKALARRFDLYWETSDREEFKRTLGRMIERAVNDAWEEQELETRKLQEQAE